MTKNIRSITTDGLLAQFIQASRPAYCTEVQMSGNLCTEFPGVKLIQLCGGQVQLVIDGRPLDLRPGDILLPTHTIRVSSAAAMLS